MSHGQFIASNNNPNDNMGGGGCICSPEKQVDCKPPYIIVPGNDMESCQSPHVVVCQRCVERMSHILSGEKLDSGEVTPEVRAEPVRVKLPRNKDVPKI